MNFRFSLYDFFGYLLPGIVAMLAAVLFIWAVYLPATPLSVFVLPKQLWLLLIVLSYFAGHFVQALGNMISALMGCTEERIFGQAADADCKVLVKQVHSIVDASIGVKNVAPIWMYRLCDVTVLHCGTASEREIFVYREGFYRGTSVSFALLTIGLFVRTVIGKTSLVWNGNQAVVPRSLLVLLIVISAACCSLMILRFYRFAQHRVRHALISFLLIHKKPTEVKNA